MYCATCGNSVNENLNYCSVCGAKIEKNLRQMRGSPASVLSIAVGFFGTAGLFGFVVILKILLESRLDQSVILLILLAYLVTLFLICGVLIGQIWSFSGNAMNEFNQAPDDYAPPKQFRAENTNQLEAPREPFIDSVTEKTTRSFDKIPRTEN